MHPLESEAKVEAAATTAEKQDPVFLAGLRNFTQNHHPSGVPRVIRTATQQSVKKARNVGHRDFGVW